MRTCAMILLTVILLCLPVNAQDVTSAQIELFGAQQLEDGLGEDAKHLMGQASAIKQSNFMDGMITVFKNAVDQSVGTLKGSLRIMLQVLLVLILCQMFASTADMAGKPAAAMFGTLAISVCCISDFRTLVGSGRNTIAEISDFSTLLLPVMVSASTAAGSVTGAALNYTLTTAFFGVLVKFCNYVLVPGVYAYLALACADSALQQGRLKRLRELVGWVIEKGLKAVVYLFTGFLTVTGALSGVTDSMTLKAAKMTISGVVPVVGGIISGAAETVLSSAAFLRNTIGTFGMVAVFAIFILPFLEIGISFFMFKISAALGGILESRLCGLLEAISAAMGYLLAMIGCCALMAMLACCSFLRSVNI